MREIARTFGSTAWAAHEPLVERSAGAGWRIARVVSGRLRSHPYADYQKDASLAAQLWNRLHARYLALASRDRAQALRALDVRLNALGRQLDDAIVLAWSSDFSEALARSRAEIRVISATLAHEPPRSDMPQQRLALGRPGPSAEHLEAALDGDWPYLAF